MNRQITLVAAFLTACPLSPNLALAQGQNVASAVALINKHMTKFQLVTVPHPAIVDRPTEAIYELRKVNNEPLVLYKPKEYVFNYNLSTDPMKYKVDDFCTALRSTALPTAPDTLRFIDAVEKLGGDSDNVFARMVREGVGEGLLAVYVLAVELGNFKLNVQASLLGSANDKSDKPTSVYGTPQAHYSFGVLRKESPPPSYSSTELPLWFNGNYKYGDIPNLRAEDFAIKVLIPTLSLCHEPTASVRILDGLMGPNDKYEDALRLYVHVFK